MMTNVIEHPTVSWERARDAFDRIQRKEGELLDAWFELGGQLNTLRAKHQADKDFGAACQDHGVDLTHQHRKAAMWWANLDADQRDTLRQYNPAALHPATLERRCYDQFPDWLTSTRSGLRSAETAERTACETENAHETAQNPPESSETGIVNNASEDSSVNIPRLDGRNILYRLMGEDVASAIYKQWTETNTRSSFRTLVKAKGGQKAIKRIVSMIPEYCTAPNTCSMEYKFSHRVFVPEIDHCKWASNHGCDWGNARAIHHILDEIPKAKRMADALGPGRALREYEDWWENETAAQKNSGPNLDAFSTVTEDKPRIRAADGSENDPIRAYGANIWPGETSSYTFDEAWAAYMLWHTEDKVLSTANGFERAEARGRHFMSQCDYLNRLSRGFVSAFRKIASAQHYNPGKADDCCCPHQNINIA